MATSSIASLILFPIVLFTLSSSALAYDINPFVYNNEYDDPFHPLCKRRIEVSKDGTTFHYSGTAVGPKNDPILRGCSNEEIRLYKLRKGAFDGFILADGKISAGDGIHEGIWEPAGSIPAFAAKNNDDKEVQVLFQKYRDVDGIRWNDGNKWIVHTKSQIVIVGEYIFYSYIGFSTLAGIKGFYDGMIRMKQNGEDQYV